MPNATTMIAPPHRGLGAGDDRSAATLALTLALTLTTKSEATYLQPLTNSTNNACIYLKSIFTPQL
jgi:hypothetical protein